jgi:hypothetical protein
LERDEEEVEDIQAMENIEEILHIMYERKTGGPRSGTKGRNPIQNTVSVEPTTPCATNTPKKKPVFRKPNFSGRNTTGHTSNKGASTRGAILGSNNQLSTLCGGSSSTQFKIP